MSHTKRFLYTISLLTLVGLSPAAAQAGPVDVATMDTTALRALFHGPAFGSVDPLVVYGEDFSDAASMRAATPGPRPMPTAADSDRATSVVHEMLRDPDVGSPDGLDDYVTAFAGVEPLRLSKLTR
jgi:hypothetical protein